MPCIDPAAEPAAVPALPCQGRLARYLRPLARTGLAALLAACSSPMPPHRAPPVAAGSPPERSPSAVQAPSRAMPLGAPRTASSWREFRRQAAERLVASSPGRSYLGEVPEVLLAIPVLEVELNADGSVRRVVVLRHPRQATDTTQLAIDAVHRAAPYGPVSHLPRPWKFAETFLFNDARHFKPRTLDD